MLDIEMTDERQLRFEITRAISGKAMRPSRRNARLSGSIRGRERLDDDWEATYEFGSRDGALIISEIRIRPVSDDPPMTPLRIAVLRERLRPGDVLTQARTALLDNVAPDILEDFHALTPGKVEKPTARSRRPDYWYAIVAAHCEIASLRGSTQPNVDAANSLGPGWTKREVRDVLTAAKRRKVWMPGAHGTRNGGRLSDIGLAVLRAGPPDGYSGPTASSQMVRDDLEQVGPPAHLNEPVKTTGLAGFPDPVASARLAR